MEAKKISVSSNFPATPDEVWSRLTEIKTLQYIASPYAYFSPLDSDNEFAWREGMSAQFRLRVFGFVPLGLHTINMIKFSKENYCILSNEKNASVPIWNHTIILKPIGDGTTHYEDIVEIEAGWKTRIVCIWAKMFYQHRQKKWLKLL